MVNDKFSLRTTDYRLPITDYYPPIYRIITIFKNTIY